MRILEGKVFVHVQHAAPVQLDKRGVNPEIAQTVAFAALGANACADDGLTGAHVQAVTFSGLQGAPEVDPIDAVPSARTGQPRVRTLICRETVTRLVVAPAQAQQGVPYAVVSHRHMAGWAHGVQRVTRDDVDHAQKGPRPVGGRIGAPDDLDALNVINGHCLQARPGTAQQKGGVNRAPVDHDLHPVGVVFQVEVVAGLGGVGFK